MVCVREKKRWSDDMGTGRTEKERCCFDIEFCQSLIYSFGDGCFLVKWRMILDRNKCFLAGEVTVS